MVSLFRTCRTMLPSFLSVILLFACSGGGCTKTGDKNSGGVQMQGTDMSRLSTKLRSLNSVSWYLVASDFDSFRPGRAKDDILQDVQWRGHFYMAAEYRCQSVCAIIYELLSGVPDDKGGVWVWAIFVDNNFVKFVRPLPTLPDDMVVVDHRETPWSRPKPLKVGDTRFLIRAMDGEAVSIADLKKEVKSLTSAPEQHIDPGLTAAYLLLRAMGVAPGPDPPASEKDYERNAALRDQFNAARLNIGMTESEVEAVLKAKPLESGRVDAGLYKIYGSNESFDIDTWLHFSNILVVLREGKVIAIQNLPAGYDWRREVGKVFADLPKGG